MLTVTAEDGHGGPTVTDTLTAIVRVSNPNIYVKFYPIKRLAIRYQKGSDVPLIVIVGNPSQTRLKDVTLDATLTPIVASEGERAQQEK
ncbi:MAG: hypothetical protein R3C44_07740 [Chloroflexota bacterium]